MQDVKAEVDQIECDPDLASTSSATSKAGARDSEQELKSLKSKPKKGAAAAADDDDLDFEDDDDEDGVTRLSPEVNNKGNTYCYVGCCCWKDIDLSSNMSNGVSFDVNRYS